MLFKETITRAAEGESRYLRFLGPRSEFAQIKVRLAPAPLGSGLHLLPINPQFFPANFFPGVAQGLMSALASGPAGRYEVTDIEAEVMHGAYHEADSSVHAFALATAEAVRKALETAGPRLLEPLVRLTLEVPEELVGVVVGELNSRCGKILGMEASQVEIEGLTLPVEQVIQASLPEREVAAMRELILAIPGDRVGFLTDPEGGYEYLPESVARQMRYCTTCERKVLPARSGRCPDCRASLGSGDDFMTV